MNTEDYDDYMGTAASVVEEIEDDVDSLFMVSDGDLKDGKLLCMAIEEDEGLSARVTAQMDQMMAARPFFAALATRIGWSPDDDTPTSAGWLLVGVDTEHAAYFCVKRDAEDDKWWRVDTGAAPWFAVSTAGSLRDALIHGTPLRPKDANAKPELFKSMSESPPPAADEDGLL